MLLRKEEKIQNFLLDNPNKITPQRMALNKKVYSINLEQAEVLKFVLSYTFSTEEVIYFYHVQYLY